MPWIPGNRFWDSSVFTLREEHVQLLIHRLPSLSKVLLLAIKNRAGNALNCIKTDPFLTNICFQTDFIFTYAENHSGDGFISPGETKSTMMNIRARRKERHCNDDMIRFCHPAVPGVVVEYIQPVAELGGIVFAEFSFGLIGDFLSRNPLIKTPKNAVIIARSR